MIRMLFVCKFWVVLVFIDSFLLFGNVCCGTLDIDEGQNGCQKYRVDGTVSIPFTVDQSWTSNTRVIVDGGQRLAFLRFHRLIRRLNINVDLAEVLGPSLYFPVVNHC